MRKKRTLLAREDLKKKRDAVYEAVHQMKSFPEHGTECQKPFISSGFAVCPPIQISDDHRVLYEQGSR